MMKNDNWIQTLDGKQFWPQNPTPEVISVNVIITVLGRIARFGGHSKRFYSVLEHSIYVAQIVEEPILKLPALLHDAHEVYSGFGDVCTPVKRLCPEISGIENCIDKAIAEAFGFDADLFGHGSIHYADLVMAITEKRDLMGEEPAKWPLLAGEEPVEMDIKEAPYRLPQLWFRDVFNEYKVIHAHSGS